MVLDGGASVCFDVQHVVAWREAKIVYVEAVLARIHVGDAGHVIRVTLTGSKDFVVINGPLGPADLPAQRSAVG